MIYQTQGEIVSGELSGFGLPAGIDPGAYNKGIEILKMFHKAALKYPNYGLTFEELTNVYGNKTPYLIELLGGDQELLGVSTSQIQSAMQKLADLGQGQVPEYWQAMHDALTQESLDTSFWDALTYTSVESAKDIAEGFREVGGSIITTGKILNYLLPAIGVGFVLLFLWNKTKAKSII